MKSKKNAFSVIVAFVALVLIGFSFIPVLNIQFEPTKSLPSLSVSYRWYNASARIIEQEVTTKLEGLFSSVKGVQSVNSVSYKGSGRISLNFKKNADIDALRFEVATLIRQVYPKLPKGVTFPMLSISSSGGRISPILTYTLNGSASPHYIQKYAESYLLPRLSVIPGVNEVSISGGTDYEWVITFNSKLIQTLKLNASDISNAIRTYFGEEVLGTVDIESNEGLIRPITLKLKQDCSKNNDWGNIEIAKVEGRTIYLGDIAKIKYQESPPRYYYRINGLNTVNIRILPEPGVNTIKLAKTVRAKVDLLKGELQNGYSLLLSNDSTEFLSKELYKIGYRTILSMIILLLFVLIISRQIRYLLLIVFSLVANLVVAFIFYYLFDVEIHLYSLAGVTVSFGIIIDNSIVMIDHVRHQNNRKVFVAILAATLTTIGSLCIIFFLDANDRRNLVDFAWVIIINLSVSMAIALFFIPALMDKIRLKKTLNRRFFKRKRVTVRLQKGYGHFVLFARRWRWAFVVLFILGFGLPIHWLPAQIKGEGFWIETYNKTIGGNWYQQTAKPIAEKALGGSLRLFTEHVFESSFYSSPQRTKLYVNGTMPEGCTIQQLNEVVGKMENFISQFVEIESFITEIYSYKRSRISITFKDEFENSGFPFFLKDQITSKAISLGNLDWGVYGVGRSFSNSLGSGGKPAQIILEGYNYQLLYQIAMDAKKELEKNNRIDKVDIAGRVSWRSAGALDEYYIDFNDENFALNNVNIYGFYSFLQNRTYRQQLPRVFYNNELQAVTLISDEYGKFDVWQLANEPIQIGDKQLKMSSLGSVSKQKTGNEIYKYNQNYQLTLAYDFVGPHRLANIIRKRHVERLEEELPLGFKAYEKGYGWWNKDNKKQYYLLLLIILIVYFICSILLESLLQPLAIISLIPISFIGVFLTFYLFDFNFDQGGFASFILLCGLVVNAGVYIINDFNQFKRNSNRSGFACYLKAFNHKVIPIFLTIISTVLGLLPFVWAGQNEVFWFAFSVGAMGGLMFSFIAVLLFLPLFTRFKRRATNVDR